VRACAQMMSTGPEERRVRVCAQMSTGMQRRAEYLGYGLCAVTPEKIPEKWCEHTLEHTRTHTHAVTPEKIPEKWCEHAHTHTHTHAHTRTCIHASARSP
jgi:hypothetical protein